MNALNRPFALLLVDDDPISVLLLANLVRETLSDRVTLHTCTDPKEARQWIDDNLVDILITDLEMPDVNGLELLRFAKSKNPCAQVLFVTAHSTLDALAVALEGGATDYLLKPLNQREVTELVGDAEKRLRRWRAALAGTVAARQCQVADSSKL